ncbi:hypothetical protein GCM10011576_40660 [Micromonospora parathelypteridis]|nr:hypothetical protein GCM10011576_40660 [Micromonospora parathelypteridis]
MTIAQTKQPTSTAAMDRRLRMDGNRSQAVTRIGNSPRSGTASSLTWELLLLDVLHLEVAVAGHSYRSATDQNLRSGPGRLTMRQDQVRAHAAERAERSVAHRCRRDRFRWPVVRATG